MKLILVTTPNYFIEEDKILTALFEEGLDILHMCKPSSVPMFAERLLTLIPSQYHKRIVVHGHFYLKEEFGLKGIHLSDRNNQMPENYKGLVSTTCHTLDDICLKKPSSDYIFFTPVFENESHECGTYPLLTKDMLRNAGKMGIIDKHVIAFGGINENKISEVKDLGFGGVAIMNGLWNNFDACIDSDYHTLIEQLHRFKKLCD